MIDLLRPPHAIPPRDVRMFAVINMVGFLGIAVHVVLIPTFWWLGIHWMAELNIVSSAAWIVAWQANRAGKFSIAVNLMTSEVVLHTICAVSVLGWQSGFEYYLMGGIPFTMFNTKYRTREIVAMALGICAAFCVVYATAPTMPTVPVDPRILGTMHYGNAIIAFAAIGLASFYFRDASIAAEEQLERLASTDPLTGLLNRRRMLEVLAIEQSRAARENTGLALVIGDIDHFKRLNDSHGHNCGDAVLRHIAGILTSRLRSTDSVARWGGEEFLFVLPSTGREEARGVAENLRAGIASQPVLFEGQQIAAGMTFGIAMLGASEPISECLSRADAALYRGKEGGRNRVVCDRDPETEPDLAVPSASGHLNS